MSHRKQMLLNVWRVFACVLFLTVSMLTNTTAEDRTIEKLVSQYLSFWEMNGGISSKGIDALMKREGKCHEFQRFEVKNGNAYVVEDPLCLHERLDKFSLLVRSHIFRLVPMCGFIKDEGLNFQFVVNTKDEPNQLKTKVYEARNAHGTWEAPLFSFQSTLDHLDVPIDYSRDDLALWKFLKEDIMVAGDNFSHSDIVPWKSKKSILFWRGSQTGGWYTVHNWKSFPRSKLVLLSKVRYL